MDCQPGAAVIDKAELSELIHEVTDPRPGGAVFPGARADSAELFVGHHHCPDFAAFPFARLLQNYIPGSWDLRDSARFLGRLPAISFKLFF